MVFFDAVFPLFSKEVIFVPECKSREMKLKMVIVLISVLTFLKTHCWFYFIKERRRHVPISHVVEGGFVLQKLIKIY